MLFNHFKSNPKKKAKKAGFGILIPTLIMALLFNPENKRAQSKTIAVDHFEKVIVSPHIQVTFKEGNEESVTIENAKLPLEKINMVVSGKTLHIYLDGAKTVTKTKTVQKNGWKQKVPIYKNTMVTAVVTYKKLQDLSLRGEETFVCESLIKADKFKLKIYGESQVYLNNVQFNSLSSSIYGESYLEIKKGTIGKQRFIAYGESRINTLGVDNQITKITSYGDGSFRFNVSENLNITAFGEANVAFEGDPKIKKGLVFGEATVRKIN
ncbi:head GIN domain-containing protein [Aquimarina sp. 2201CG5-10]|uniref:head GIN domain-containing protein n=1 Tax=Aquimarina callyspongiae TaxID=3098150 RepID=UPI002AB43278|nr:head GIN domain-containing protein [Aquimarina sp. 2201CG5-10]MDY8137530.1 head GIN domain-containing protein [Aquimarina sp. 2201CG5-10]